MNRSITAALAAAASFASIAIAGSALAAPPGTPGGDWSGPYLGAELGGRWSSVDGSVNSATDNGVNILVPGSRSATVGDASSFRAGVYAGYSVQPAPNWVVGIEGDIAWGQNDRTLAHAIYPGNAFYVTGRPDDSFRVEENWDGSVRARVGYLVAPQTLLYATGGVAFTEIKSTSTCGVLSDCRAGVFPVLFAPAVINHTADQGGWTAGGGVEWNVAPHVLVRGEYRYSDYGGVAATETRFLPEFGGVTQTANFSVRLRTSTATVGVAYTFQ